MNFFEHQERARKSSTRLVLLFVLGVAAVVVAVYAVVVIGLGLSTHRGGVEQDFQGFLQPDLFLAVAGVTLAIIAIGSLVKFAGLAAGGRAVAESLGGRLVQSGTRDPDERKFVNVVEEMAIASGIPVPAMYVLEGEEGINAFAAGRTPRDAAVAVTRGCLQTLNRDELQGVIGHEFSHILNGDMRLNIRLLGLLGGVFALAVVGRILLYSGGRGRKKDGAALVMVGIVLMVVGYVGVLAGRLIQAAISRQREFLADASAVQFTRNPQGIAGALKKIRDAVLGSRVAAPQAAEVSHMFFGAPAFAGLFATHPPLDERIRRIAGAVADVPARAATGAAPASAPVAPRTSHDARARTEPVRRAAGAAGFAGAAQAVEASIGGLSDEAIAAGADLSDLVPPAVRGALGSPLGAGAVVYALLLDRSPEVRRVQMQRLADVAGAPAAREVELLHPQIAALEPRLRLPLVDLAAPALRQMSRGQHRRFLAGIDVLIVADAEVSLFEFCLQRVVLHRMGSAPRVSAAAAASLTTEEFRGHAAALLGHLARCGARSEQAAASAFAAGAAAFGKLVSPLDMPAPARDSHAGLGAALDLFSALPLKGRQAVFAACGRCVLNDDLVTLEEAELLRAVAYTLDLPLPPFAAVI